jgi:thioredoxin-dependent peroxiredoxin
MNLSEITLELAATSGHNVTLKDYQGTALIVYFYPRDDTPGCTQEGQDFRDLYPQFEQLGGVIVGISRDTVEKHKKFKQKYAFPFELLADPEEHLCQLFGVMKDKTMFGKPVRGIERSTFLFNKKGELAKEWRKVKVDGHAAAVLAALKEL